MKNLSIKSILLSLVFITLLLPVAFAYDIDIKADLLDYNQEADSVTAEGNVFVVWQDKTLHADKVVFEFPKKLMTATGKVELEENGTVVFAETMTYYYDQETGELTKTKAASSMVFIQSEKMQRLDKSNFASGRTIISNCDLDDPHTSFKAKRAILREGKKIILYGAVAYIGHLPVFYFPYLSRDLERGKEPFTVAIEPGYSEEGGVFLKTTLGFSITDNISDLLFLDYLGKYGTGYGTQLDYATDITKFSIYAYKINDEIVGTQRWALQPSFWSQVAGIWTIQSQAEFLSDPSFNNIYNRSNWNRVSNTPHSFVALTRSGKTSNLMFVVERFDTYNTESEAFAPSRVSAPRISYTLYPRKLFWDISNNFNIVYNHSGLEYSSINKNLFYRNTVNFSDILAKSLQASKNLTFMPYIGLGGDWYDKDTVGNIDETIFFTYMGGINTRLRVSSWIDWNVDYSISAKTQKNSYEIDRIGENYGIVEDLVEYSNYMYITDSLTLRNTASYDLRSFRTPSSPLSPRIRWSPIESELTYTPNEYTNIYVRHMQTLDPSVKFEGLQSEINIGDMTVAYIKVGIFYEEASRDEIDNVLGFGIWLTPKWRFDYNMRGVSNFVTQQVDINEYEVKLYRDLHCYNFGATMRVRRDPLQGYTHEISLLFNLKANMPFSKDRREEAELFYPWK
ncbi:MAG: hypothetical protein LBB93_05770 [Elusimicrobiota bacterium]|jgi:LPS-assembly protein|nr:hypothetical protein [Elusimicrobiota bacterium]